MAVVSIADMMRYSECVSSLLCDHIGMQRDIIFGRFPVPDFDAADVVFPSIVTGDVIAVCIEGFYDDTLSYDEES